MKSVVDLRARFRPLIWTGATTPADERRSGHTFKAPWSDTLDLLDRELFYLSAEDLVIEADFREQDIRLDGMPRSGAPRPGFPGVRVAFNSTHGPLIYQTDSCVMWEHNVRSIALGLQALRAVDRYGITPRAEQYQGYRAIESGIALPATVMSRSAALEVLAELAGWVRISPAQAEPELLRQAYRDAARRHHPDAAGTREGWDRLDQVKRVLGGEQRG